MSDDGPGPSEGWDPGPLEAALAEVGRLISAAPGPTASGDVPPPAGETGSWLAAHLVATHRILSAAAADLIGGGVPVVDTRSASVPEYLAAIAEAAGAGRLAQALAASTRELVSLGRQLEPGHLAAKVPAVLAEGGRIVTQAPVAFSRLLSEDHVRSHLDGIVDRDQSS